MIYVLWLLGFAVSVYLSFRLGEPEERDEEYIAFMYVTLLIGFFWPILGPIALAAAFGARHRRRLAERQRAEREALEMVDRELRR